MDTKQLAYRDEMTGRMRALASEIAARVEMALGAETDNIFRLRASIQTGEPVGRVFEVDDSAPNDV